MWEFARRYSLDPKGRTGRMVLGGMPGRKKTRIDTARHGVTPKGKQTDRLSRGWTAT
jgi:hypothetical protein